MRVGALFVDYDGTIAPLGVPREESRIFRSVERSPGGYHFRPRFAS